MILLSFPSTTCPRSSCSSCASVIAPAEQFSSPVHRLIVCPEAKVRPTETPIPRLRADSKICFCSITSGLPQPQILSQKRLYPPLSNLSRQNKQKTKLNSKKQLNKQHLFLLFPTNHTSSILNPHGKYQRKKKKTIQTHHPNSSL